MSVKQWLAPTISHRMLVKKHGSMLTKGHSYAVVWQYCQSLNNKHLFDRYHANQGS